MVFLDAHVLEAALNLQVILCYPQLHGAGEEELPTKTNLFVAQCHLCHFLVALSEECILGKPCFL